MFDLFTDHKEREIAARLTELRRNLAEKLGTEPNKLWNNKALQQLASNQPQTMEELKNIKGLSTAKIRDFGELILFAITDRAPQPVLPENPVGQTTTLSGIFEDLHQEPAEKILSVSDFISYVNQILQVAQDIKIQGEISKFNIHPTGIYVTLRDKNDDSVLNCYMNPHAYRGLGIPLEAGMEVRVSGFPTIFRRRSELSFRIEDVELAGEGALKKAYELLKKQLETEGLFTRKRPLPEFITNIGIITSKTGAVIDDFRKNLEPLGCKLYLKDCRVEGTQAVRNILSAIRYFNKALPELDCLVIMRGGGSLEDMQAFNNEQVVRAIFASSVPTICAIGHDRDVPLACLASDVFTSTPTAAAMEINHSWGRLKILLPQLQHKLVFSFQNTLESTKHHVASDIQHLSAKLFAIFHSFDKCQEQLVQHTVRLQNSIIHIRTQNRLYIKKIIQDFSKNLDLIRTAIRHTEKLLETANPERNLKLGYSITRNNSGKIIRSAKELKVGESITSQFPDGNADATITTIKR